jgi:hypothetical protein
VYLGGAWQFLGGTVDTATHTVTISVSHFTLYALMRSRAPGGLPPASVIESPASLPRSSGAPVVAGLPNTGAGDTTSHRRLDALLLAVAILAVGARVVGISFVRRRR